MKEDAKMFSARRNFTLTELLVVIAIIAVVTGMVVSAVRGLGPNQRLNASAQKLQAVLMQARALAMKRYAGTKPERIVGVIFNNAKPQSYDGVYNYGTVAAGDISTTADDWWCAIMEFDADNVKKLSDLGSFGTSRTKFFDGTSGGKVIGQVGKLYHLDEGIRFRGFTYFSDNDGYRTGTAGGSYWYQGSYGNSCSVWQQAKNHVFFLPDGSPVFSDGDWADTFRGMQIISICKEFATLKPTSKLKREQALGVYVHKLTGEVGIIPMPR